MKRPAMRSSPEFVLIRAMVDAIHAASPPEVIVGPGDDAAVLSLAAGDRLLVSSDLSVEDVHFRREWLTWKAIGYRAVAAALSDLAAMAARPLGALVSVAFPPEHGETVIGELGRGIGECLRAHDAGLLGGDLSRSPGPTMIDVTVVGSSAEPIGRSGARPGDELWVTGSLGGASAAAAAWASGLEPDPGARQRFERPTARIDEARWLADRLDVHAAIDLSDGLAADSEHMAAASEVGLEIHSDAIPLHPVLQGWAHFQAALAVACGGGEDYELLLALPPAAAGEAGPDLKAGMGVDLTRIGRVIDGEGVRWLDSRGDPHDPPAGGFDHFESGD